MAQLIQYKLIEKIDYISWFKKLIWSKKLSKLNDG